MGALSSNREYYGLTCNDYGWTLIQNHFRLTWPLPLLLVSGLFGEPELNRTRAPYLTQPDHMC